MTEVEVQEILGVVDESLPNTTFRITLTDGRVVLAHVAGRMKKNRIKILVGDRVKVRMTEYDQTRGIIVYRYND